MRKRSLFLRMANTVTSAMGVYWALENLRNGNTIEAIETLEKHLDSNILELGSLLKRVSVSDRQAVLDTLRCLQRYRLEHPRRKEGYTSDTEDAEFVDKQERIREILEEAE